VADFHSGKARVLLNLAINDSGKIPGLAVADLDLLLRVARRVRLLGRIAWQLEQNRQLGELPSIAQDHLTSALRMAAARKRLAEWEQNRLEWALIDDVDTPVVLMKGCAYLALALPNAPGRIFADVDLLVPKERLDDVETLLNETGWSAKEITPYDDNYYRRWSHELPPMVHHEREVEIDLHHSMLPTTARLKPDSCRLLQRARRIEGSRFSVLCDEDITLHAMVHLFVDSDLSDRLRDLVDIAELLRTFQQQDENFWTGLVRRADELGLRRPLYYSLRYANLLLGTELPAEIRSVLKRWRPVWPISALMDAIVPQALYPGHPDHPSRRARVGRLLLFIRSHWIRMPPWLLFYHLSYKFYVTRIIRTQRKSA